MPLENRLCLLTDRNNNSKIYNSVKMGDYLILQNLLFTNYVFGNDTFGLCLDSRHPFLSVFGLEIYLYAIVIVFGMCLAIITAGLYFKKRGYDPYDITIYALIVIPVGVLGARAYVYIFPWSGGEADWSTYFNFRSGGLGIYGGVIMGYLAALVTAKIRKQDFRIVADSIMPGLFLAQSVGRWGNYFNQEAYGNLIEGLAAPVVTPNSLPVFNGYAVWIEAKQGWYQATFFYESVCTFLGFLICVLVLTRSKHYKLGWCAAFYGIYYGIVRLVIEGFRSDSLYLYVGHFETDIKISQLVSVFAILFGLLTLSKIYRREIHGIYKKLFKNDYDEISKSRWILLAFAIVCLALGITMLCLGGESKLIAGVILLAVAVYSGLGVWSLFDRLKVYCNICQESRVPSENWQTEYDKAFTSTICYGVIMGALFCFGLFSLIKWGIYDKISNGTVLAVISLVLIGVIGGTKFYKSLRQLLSLKRTDCENQSKCGECGNVYNYKLNKFLLFVFPPKVYLDYGVENLKPWVDPNAGKRKNKKKNNADAEETETSAPDDAQSDADKQ